MSKNVVPGASEGRVDAVLTRLEEVTGVPPRGGNGSWLAQCPAHETTTNRTDNLTVSEGETGRVLLSCRGGEGCDAKEIVTALGMHLSDLAPANGIGRSAATRSARRRPTPKTPAKKKKVKETHEFGSDGVRWTRYVYRDADGEPLFRVIRGDCVRCMTLPEKEHNKRISQHTYIGGPVDKKESWRKKVDVSLYTLYHLPELIAAVEEGREVWIVEGEKSVQAAEENGQIATTSPGGALKWRDEYSRYFKGATVKIVADNDDKGRRHAIQVYRSVMAAGAWSAEIVRSTHRHDFADHVADGGGTDVVDGER